MRISVFAVLLGLTIHNLEARQPALGAEENDQIPPVTTLLQPIQEQVHQLMPIMVRFLSHEKAWRKQYLTYIRECIRPDGATPRFSPYEKSYILLSKIRGALTADLQRLEIIREGNLMMMQGHVRIPRPSLEASVLLQNLTIWQVSSRLDQALEAENTFLQMGRLLAMQKRRREESVHQHTAKQMRRHTQ